jgi:hypothetical protein
MPVASAFGKSAGRLPTKSTSIQQTHASHRTDHSIGLPLATKFPYVIDNQKSNKTQS